MSPGTGDDRPPSISHSLTSMTSTAIAALLRIFPLRPQYGGVWRRRLAHANPHRYDAGDQPAAPAEASSRKPNTRCVFEKPAIGNSPSSLQPSLETPANAADATTVRESLPAIFSTRAAGLT